MKKLVQTVLATLILNGCEAVPSHVVIRSTEIYPAPVLVVPLQSVCWR